jgi:NTP pyrophosphatase (non-canonical NTP hydrolase)
MLITDYIEFVDSSNLTKGRPQHRLDVALYGLAGEIGSLTSAVKKRLLAGGKTDWDSPNAEIIEELGDSCWYCFAVAEAFGELDFMAQDIRNLHTELSAGDDRAKAIADILGAARVKKFLQRAPKFEAKWNNATATFDEYQKTAFLTSRTKPDELVEVCLAVLQQLVAELFRNKLPPIEQELNKQLCDRQPNMILGEIIWHLSALASLYQLALSTVLEVNRQKLERRFGRGAPTPLKDKGRNEAERLPRRFEIAFVTIGEGRSRMYMNGRRLGDDLTDNSHSEDGYRFHDVMHLALAAKLGWSPVLRKLMGKKRRTDSKLDEVEDGARAAIIEEAVIKAIHSEGVRLATLRNPRGDSKPGLFANGADISFGFLRRLDDFVSGLEVEANKYWEWEDAIVAGFEIFEKLRSVGQGTVSVDVNARSLSFSPDVLIDLHGTIGALGVVKLAGVQPNASVPAGEVKRLHYKYGILDALDCSRDLIGDIQIGAVKGKLVSIRATGKVQKILWKKKIISFRVAITEQGTDSLVTVLGICDD